MFLWRRKWQPTPVFWRIPWTEELGGLPSTVTKRHDWATSLSLHFMFLVYFFFLSLPCSATSELPASLILYLSLKSFQPLLLQIFFSTVSFFPSSTTNAHINFAIVLYLLDTMLSFPSLSLSLFLSVFGNIWGLSLDLFSVSLNFLSLCRRHYFCTVFLISSISFWFFLRISISVIMVHIFSCILSTFPLKPITPYS